MSSGLENAFQPSSVQILIVYVTKVRLHQCFFNAILLPIERLIAITEMHFFPEHTQPGERNIIVYALLRIFLYLTFAVYPAVKNYFCKPKISRFLLLHVIKVPSSKTSY